MKSFTCDVCGRTSTNSYDIYTIREDLRPDTITDLCRKCQKDYEKIRIQCHELAVFYETNLIKERLLNLKLQKGEKA